MAKMEKVSIQITDGIELGRKLIFVRCTGRCFSGMSPAQVLVDYILDFVKEQSKKSKSELALSDLVPIVVDYSQR